MADDTTEDLPYITQQDRDENDGTSDVQVQSPVGKGPDTASALLRAAEDLGYGPEAIRTADGHFLVSQEIADHAKLPEGDATVVQPDGGASANATGDPAADDPDGLGSNGAPVAPEFATKADAKAFADEHNLDVDGSLHAEEYKQAVADAYTASRA